ncbi:hypothetical protein BVC80_9005g44 [Macleaya cordata]|uniref:Protein EARLY FLOWERING 3 n=1 Tax=Macleaya cordata TaxID=56857 RepID=A0A200QLN7_MACCD|nr:hypothetical protein BVC80_9005g44 [Macleaya cordata]
MKSGKDEEKNMGPLFPRLHVNDTEKGGPRAPPRNKMALYEQLSIPSQRFNSGSASTLPLPPPSNTNSLVSSSSASISQGGGHERTVFSSYYIPPHSPANLAEELHSRSSDLSFKTTTPDFEQKSTNNANYRASNAMGNLSSSAECSSFRTRYFPNSQNSYPKKLGDEDDFRVPTFAQPGIGSCTTNNQQNVEREIPTRFAPVNNTSRVVSGTCTSSSQLHNARDKHLKRPNTTDLRSRQHVRDQDEENMRESITRKDCVEKTTSHPSTGEKIAESIKHVYASDSRHHNSLVDDLGRSNKVNAQLHQECRAPFLPENNDRSDGVLDDPIVYVEEVNISRVRNEPCARASLGNGHRSPNKFGENKTHLVSEVEELDRNDDVSETSILDSVSSLDISPDDVVGVIGQKQFWKARKAIANQQRVFSVQVFELHRLIKVQRLFAGSPHLLVADNPYLVRPSLKESPAKKLPSKYVVKSLPEVLKKKDDSSKGNRSTEFTAENAIEKPPLPSISDGIDRRNVNQHPTYGQYSENPLSAPPAANNQPGWCFHPPPANQWLVPIMSPSEGLVYKPYSGPCPPAAGFMTPFYGGCGPMNLPPMSGDFLNPAYRFPASHQQPMGHHPATPVTPTYFPPYGTPVMNSAVSPSTVNQVSPLTEQLSTGEFDFNMHSRNSCNTSKNQRSDAISRRFSKFQTSKESEFQGSTASSPSGRAQGVGTGTISESMDALPLFPTAPAVQDSDEAPQINNCDKEYTRAIKVVPHNPRSANESAARIFRSIQEERQQFESM